MLFDLLPINWSIQKQLSKWYFIGSFKFDLEKKTSDRNLTALIFYERIQMACVIYNCVANITKFLQAVQSLHFIIKNDYRRMKSLCIWSINKVQALLDYF